MLTEHDAKIAPRTFYAWASRPPSKRALWDATITEVLAGYYEPDESGRRKPEALYGSLKMWAHLNREGIEVARCTVERLMAANGWQGVRRTKKVRTTVADPSAERAPDLVDRQFRVPAPNRLFVADFTYVKLIAGVFVYVAFVIDAYAGRIVGWEASTSKVTRFVVNHPGSVGDSVVWVSNPGGVGLLGSVERCLELCWGHVVAVAVQALLVEPVHPGEGRELELVDAVPARGVGPVDALGLVEPVRGLGERVVVAVRNRPDRGLGADLVEAFGESHRRKLRPGIGVGNQPDQTAAPRERRAISSASRTMSVRMFDATRHPTIRRENPSTMKHT